MKQIWIDGYEANVAQRLGSGQVAYELIRNIEQYDRKNDFTVLLPNAPLPDMPKEREGFRYRILKPNKLWTRFAIPFEFIKSKNKPDVIFSPTHYIPRFISAKRVATIFDLSYIYFPQMFTKKDLWQLKEGTKYSVFNASHIITISNSSKKDIIKNYSIGKDKVTVCYPGFDSSVFYRDTTKIEKAKVKYGISQNYIIYIGTIQPRKNLDRLIEAFSRVVQEGKDLQLVLVGKSGGSGRKGWMYEEIMKKPEKLGIGEKVKFLGYVEKEDLPALLGGALAFVLVSLYEGFGLTIVEAMACGTPVLASNVSSIPEVVGKAGLLVKPESVDQIEQAIRLISTEKNLRNKLSKRGMEQAKKFSWKKMAKDVVKVLELV